MRIRLSLSDPFASSKLLLPVPEDVATISALKKHLFKSLSAISSVAPSWRELKLDIGGFELVAGSGLDVIEEGDVVQSV